MIERGWVVARGFVALGIVALSLVGCSGGDDDDCLQTKSTTTVGLISDCSGTYCETDADCPSDRRCMRGGFAYVVETGIPIGCQVPSAGGSCVEGTTPSESCFTVTSPQDYDVKTECTSVGGMYATEDCDETLYAQKCTETVASQQNDVTYVRYYSAGTNVVCSGTLEDL